MCYLPPTEKKIKVASTNKWRGRIVTLRRASSHAPVVQPQPRTICSRGSSRIVSDPAIRILISKDLKSSN
jgi:hypothetical protein